MKENKRKLEKYIPSRKKWRTSSNGFFPPMASSWNGGRKKKEERDREKEFPVAAKTGIGTPLFRPNKY